jgi:glycerol-3-phosphate acyltransferase PlsY
MSGTWRAFSVEETDSQQLAWNNHEDTSSMTGEWSPSARIVLHVIVAYLLGSFPSAYIIGYLFKGVDIRRIGDGNVGARNTGRHIGPLAGVLVAVLDISKGYVAVLLAQGAGLARYWVLAVGAFAILGHDSMPLLGFRGGQGMAATVGALLAVLPIPTAIGVTAALTMRFVLGIDFDLSGAVGLGAIPLLAWIQHEPPELVLYPVALLPVIGMLKLVKTYIRRQRSTTPASRSAE